MDSIEVGTIASPLGDWTFARYRPQPHEPLAASLDSAWYFDGVLTHSRERVFPKGTHGLIVQLDEPHRATTGERFPQLVYNGMYTSAIVVAAPPGRVRVIGIEFTPSGGFAFAGRGHGETIDCEVDVRDLFGSAAERLLEACRRERTPAAILRRAIAFCAQRIRTADACERSVSAALQHIERSGGQSRMRDLAEEIGRSERALARAFRERVGIVPKRYARIRRFVHAHDLLLAPSPELADVAARAGYYDQAHFNADFAEHAGLTPTRFLESERFPGGRSIAEPSG